ncbi:MAG TPA: hypothetical protein VFY37_11100 [Solirubrobacterales bacterium]|nr:hypothetical protein [Solirubrobacterales bacterium]
MPDGAGIPVENPATGETIATVPELGGEEVRIEIVPREYVTFSAHQMGTCRMARRTAHAIAAA